MAYAAYVFYDITKRSLLPESGRTRVLLIYFARFLIMYFDFYMPKVLVSVVYMEARDPTAILLARGVFYLLIPLQCFGTVLIASTKHDISKIVAPILGTAWVHRRLCVTWKPPTTDFVGSTSTFFRRAVQRGNGMNREAPQNATNHDGADSKA